MLLLWPFLREQVGKSDGNAYKIRGMTELFIIKCSMEFLLGPKFILTALSTTLLRFWVKFLDTEKLVNLNPRAQNDIHISIRMLAGQTGRRWDLCRGGRRAIKHPSRGRTKAGAAYRRSSGGGGRCDTAGVLHSHNRCVVCSRVSQGKKRESVNSPLEYRQLRRIFPELQLISTTQLSECGCRNR